MTTYTWQVTQMQCYPQAEGETDVVFNVAWQCVGEQVVGGVSVYGRVYNNTAVTYEQGSPYTPYDQLTQDQVLGWVWASGVDQAEVEANVQAAIDNQINPPIIMPPLPWVTPAA